MQFNPPVCVLINNRNEKLQLETPLRQFCAVDYKINKAVQTLQVRE